jgi:hypothetical protein
MTVSISSKSAYAPIRYQSTRPWWKVLGKASAEARRIDKSLQADYFQKHLAPIVNRQMIEGAKIYDNDILLNEASLGDITGCFMMGGRAIYDFSSRLTDILMVTDFADTTVSDVFKSDMYLYLHFGDHPCLTFEKNHYEGMWVEFIHSELRLTIHPARHNSFKCKPALSADNEKIDSISFRSVYDEEPIQGMLIRTMNIMRNGMADKRILDFQGSSDKKVKNEHIEYFETIQNRLFNLCMSAICFIKAKPDDIDYGWPSDAPARMVEQAFNTKDAGRKATAESSLDNDGFIKIAYVGARYNKLENEPRIFSQGASDSEIKRVMSTHPRRGFFRRQRHGEGRLEIKIVYIAPTVVNPGGKSGAGKVFVMSEN